MPSRDDDQLELFDMSNAANAEARLRVAGRVRWNIRYDQLILACIGGLIGLTVVFSLGVERGKRLARLERSLLAAHQQPVVQKQAPAQLNKIVALAEPEAVEANQVSHESQAPEVTVAQNEPRVVTEQTQAVPRPAREQASTHSEARFAIQVVTYNSLQFAKREMDKLQQLGERAFIVNKDEHTILYAGPYDTKEKAYAKRSQLREKYHDCFVRTL